MIPTHVQQTVACLHGCESVNGSEALAFAFGRCRVVYNRCRSTPHRHGKQQKHRHGKQQKPAGGPKGRDSGAAQTQMGASRAPDPPQRNSTLGQPSTKQAATRHLVRSVQGSSVVTPEHTHATFTCIKLALHGVTACKSPAGAARRVGQAWRAPGCCMCTMTPEWARTQKCLAIASAAHLAQPRPPASGGVSTACA